jgi:hypothetical protein
MNDTELDDMLNQWDAPPAPPSLREKVRAGLALGRGRKRIGERFAWPTWHVGKGLFAGMAAGAVVFLFVIAQAFPQAMGMSVPSPVLGYPYLVRSNVIAYAPDGSWRVEATLFSYSYKGSEIVVTETHPGNPLEDWLMGFHNGIHYALLRYMPGLVVPESAAKDAWFSAYVQAGCVDKGENAVGHETIRKHETTVVQHIDPDGWRGTVWRAPDLGCFALETKSEEPVAGGYRLVRQRGAVMVFVRGGHPWKQE